MVNGLPFLDEVVQGCRSCGNATLQDGRSGKLATFERDSVLSIYESARKLAEHISQATATSADALSLPSEHELEDLGLLHSVPFEAKLGLTTTEADLLTYVGIAPGISKRGIVGVPEPLTEIIITTYAVEHLTEDRRRRWNESHVSYFPLIVNTLKRPFEIWHGAGKANPAKKNYRFLALYRQGHDTFVHQVICNGRKRLTTSHRLSSWSQVASRRDGVPLYKAY